MTTVDAGWCLLGAALLLALVVSPDTVGSAVGLRRFLTPEIGPAWQVAQRFTMDARGLSAIEIRAHRVGEAAGTFVVTLRDRDAPDTVRRTEVPAAELVRGASYTVRFDPIARSQNHEFELAIAPSPADPGRGVALWATKGETDAGALRINGAERWASLAFQTHTPSVSLGRSFFRAEAGRPPRWLGLIALIGQWLALRVVLRALVARTGSAVPGSPVAHA
jgi:hypothetical protein